MGSLCKILVECTTARALMGFGNWSKYWKRRNVDKKVVMRKSQRNILCQWFHLHIV